MTANKRRKLTAPATALPAALPAALPTVLLTGFDAFGGDALNPSWLAVQALHGEVIEGHALVAAQLPTEFTASTKVLLRLMRRYRPALVIAVGLAGGRSALSLERVAINIRDARIPDNADAQPVDLPVVKRGPAAYFSTLPIKAMQQAIETEGVAAEISQTAGTFVCNHVFYALMHYLQTATGWSLTGSARGQSGNKPQSQNVIGKTPRGGFIHLPYLPKQGVPNMALADMVRGLRAACACALTTDKDLVRGAGAIN